jgi:hypothetical protein
MGFLPLSTTTTSASSITRKVPVRIILFAILCLQGGLSAWVARTFYSLMILRFLLLLLLLLLYWRRFGFHSRSGSSWRRRLLCTGILITTTKEPSASISYDK